MSTFRNRRLSFKATLNNKEALVDLFELAAQNFAVSIRNEVLNDATASLERHAKRFIREGKADNVQYPDRSYDLENSFESYYDEEDTMQVSMGRGIPYAEIHNLPIGTFVQIPRRIRPKKRLVFKDKRAGKDHWVSPKKVMRGGIAYWDRALDEVKKEMPKIVKKWVEYYSDVDMTIQPGSGAQLRGNRRSNLHKPAGHRL